MSRIQLHFNGISEVVGNSKMSVIVLTDMEKKRALSFVCDEIMKYQISFRLSDKTLSKTFVPEVLIHLLKDLVDIQRFEIMIHGIDEGEYKVALLDANALSSYPIRLSDAVLLSLICSLPLYIDTKLMLKQSEPYKLNSSRMSIPINSITTQQLKEELKKAIEQENYRLASYIKEELENRE